MEMNKKEDEYENVKSNNGRFPLKSRERKMSTAEDESYMLS